MKDYSIVNGRSYVVLARNKKRDNIFETDVCNFCGEKHYHGTNEGHRSPHCRNKKDKWGNFLEAPDEYTTQDGVAHNYREGYIIKEY